MGWDDLPNTKTMNTPDNIIPQEALAIYDSIDDKEILTLAAHRSGYEGELSEEELDDIKLAIKVALARHNKIQIIWEWNKHMNEYEKMLSKAYEEGIIVDDRAT